MARADLEAEAPGVTEWAHVFAESEDATFLQHMHDVSRDACALICDVSNSVQSTQPFAGCARKPFCC